MNTKNIALGTLQIIGMILIFSFLIFGYISLKFFYQEEVVKKEFEKAIPVIDSHEELLLQEIGAEQVMAVAFTFRYILNEEGSSKIEYARVEVMHNATYPVVLETVTLTQLGWDKLLMQASFPEEYVQRMQDSLNQSNRFAWAGLGKSASTCLSDLDHASFNESVAQRCVEIDMIDFKNISRKAATDRFSDVLNGTRVSVKSQLPRNISAEVWQDIGPYKPFEVWLFPHASTHLYGIPTQEKQMGVLRLDASSGYYIKIPFYDIRTAAFPYEFIVSNITLEDTFDVSLIDSISGAVAAYNATYMQGKEYWFTSINDNPCFFFGNSTQTESVYCVQQNMSILIVPSCVGRACAFPGKEELVNFTRSYLQAVQASP